MTPTMTPITRRAAIRPRSMPSAEQDARDRDRDEQQDPVQHAPAHRAEDPFPEEQRRPDDDAG